MAAIKFTGLASGIDSASLIDALIEARETQNVSRKKEIGYLQDQNDVLDELNTKILTLTDLVERFRTVNNGGVFKKASSSDATVATATVAPNGASSSFSVTVNTLAKNAVGTLGGIGTYSSSTAVMTPAGGMINIVVGEGADQKSDSIVMTAGVTTLQDVANDINSNSDFSGRLTASIVNTGSSSSPSYKIVLTTLYEGTAKGKLDVTLGGTGDVIYVESDADNATFNIAGIGAFTRSSNSVTDIFPGTTLNLLKGGGSTATITIGSDAVGTSDLMKQIVTQFNDIVEFINENDTATQDKNDRNGTIIYGSLAKTRVDNDFISQFKTALIDAYSSLGGAVGTMADLGILTNRDGTLEYDEDKFMEKILSDPSGATQVLNSFADAAGGTNGVLYQFTKFRGFIDLAQESNLAEIDNLNEKIAQVERGSEKVRASLELKFSRLESLTGQFQSTQQALSGILAGLAS